MWGSLREGFREGTSTASEGDGTRSTFEQQNTPTERRKTWHRARYGIMGLQEEGYTVGEKMMV